jgi:hypothetical protein
VFGALGLCKNFCNFAVGKQNSFVTQKYMMKNAYNAHYARCSQEQSDNSSAARQGYYTCRNLSKEVSRLFTVSGFDVSVGEVGSNGDVVRSKFEMEIGDHPKKTGANPQKP